MIVCAHVCAWCLMSHWVNFKWSVHVCLCSQWRPVGVKCLLSASHELLWEEGGKFLLLVLGDVIFTLARLLWWLLTMWECRQWLQTKKGTCTVFLFGWVVNTVAQSILGILKLNLEITENRLHSPFHIIREQVQCFHRENHYKNCEQEQTRL